MTTVRVRCPDHGIVDQNHTEVVVDMEDRSVIVWCPRKHSFVAPAPDGIIELLIDGGCKTVEQTVQDFVVDLEGL